MGTAPFERLGEVMSSGPQAVKRPWHAWACRCGVTAARATSGTCSMMGCRRRTSVSGALLARYKHSAHLILGLLGAWACAGVDSGVCWRAQHERRRDAICAQRGLMRSCHQAWQCLAAVTRSPCGLSRCAWQIALRRLDWFCRDLTALPPRVSTPMPFATEFSRTRLL